jgi:hypothetical protein
MRPYRWGAWTNGAAIWDRVRLEEYVGLLDENWGDAAEQQVSILQHTSAYVSIRQHTSAYVSIRQHTYEEYVGLLDENWGRAAGLLTYADVCLRMLAYADVC